MSDRRWQAPPLKPPANKEQTSQPETGPVVDEQVVRKMLQVNPALRQGRSTQQVKRALEAGKPLAEAGAETAASKSPLLGSEFKQAVAFFMRGKAKHLDEELAQVAAKRRALEAEEEVLRSQLREQVVGFVSLLDARLVDDHGDETLASHAEFLKKLKLSPADLLKLVRKNRK